MGHGRGGVMCAHFDALGDQREGDPERPCFDQGPADPAAPDVALVPAELGDLLVQVEGEVLSGESTGDGRQGDLRALQDLESNRHFNPNLDPLVPVQSWRKSEDVRVRVHRLSPRVMPYSNKTARLTVSSERSLSQAKTPVGATTRPSVGTSPHVPHHPPPSPLPGRAKGRSKDITKDFIRHNRSGRELLRGTQGARAQLTRSIPWLRVFVEGVVIVGSQSEAGNHEAGKRL